MSSHEIPTSASSAATLQPSSEIAPTPIPVPAPVSESQPSQTVSMEVESPWGLSAGDRRFLLVTGSLILILLGLHWARLSGWGTREIEILRLPQRRYDFKIDINRGTWVEWMQIDGIGELTARRIIADREEHGPFTSIDDLQRVKGIGPATLEKLRPWLTCPDCAAPAE